MEQHQQSRQSGQTEPGSTPTQSQSGNPREMEPGKRSSTGPRGEATRLIKASYYFLRREQARRAWVIFLVCIGVTFIPWPWPEVRTGAIVLAGVAAGAIFLPELNSGLWRLKSKEIRDTIPEHRRRAFYTELIRADCPEDEWAQRWAELMWQKGVMPLLDAAKDTSRIRWDMNYEVSVHLHREIPIGRKKQFMAWIEARVDHKRVLPLTTDNLLWVSFAGNDASLLSEFNQSGCLVRELVGLPGLSKDAWVAAVRKWCQVRVQIGERTVSFAPENLVTVPGNNDVRIVRWPVRLSDDELDSKPVACQVEMHFPTEIRENNFPALLAGYYCAGRTVISFKLYHGRGPRPILRYFDEFLSEGGGSIDAWRPKRFDTNERQSVSYSTPSDSLLWPGSGIYFWWEFTEL